VWLRIVPSERRAYTLDRLCSLQAAFTKAMNV
jgi:hypothetical protein